MTVELKPPAKLKLQFDPKLIDSEERTRMMLAEKMVQTIREFLDNTDTEDIMRYACKFSRFAEYIGKGVVQGDRVYY